MKRFKLEEHITKDGVILNEDYIQFFATAKEVQSSWEPKYGDTYINKQIDVVYAKYNQCLVVGGYNCVKTTTTGLNNSFTKIDYFPNKPNPSDVWIPHIAQMMVMLMGEGRHSFSEHNLIWDFHEWYSHNARYKSDNPFIESGERQMHEGFLLEQIWFAFLMFKLFKKVWNDIDKRWDSIKRSKYGKSKDSENS